MTMNAGIKKSVFCGLTRAVSPEQQNEPVDTGNGTVDIENEPVDAGNEPVEEKLGPLQVQLVKLIQKDPDITYDQMAEATGRGRSTIRRHIKELRESNHVRRVGSDRHGHWEVINGGRGA
jgi:predicted HTH transcriptional regulator